MISTELQTLYEQNNITDYNKLSIHNLNNIYSHLASLPLKRNENGLIDASRLVNLLHVTRGDVTRIFHGGLEIRHKYDILGLYLLDKYGNKCVDIDNLTSEIHVINTPIGGVYSSSFAHKTTYMPLEDLKLFMQLQQEFTPSKWCSTEGPAYATPETSSVCPFMLLAFKRYQGIQYNEWDKTSDRIEMLLPRALQSLPKSALARQIGRQDAHEMLRLMFYTNKSKQQVTPAGYPLLALNTAIPRAVELGIREKGVELSPAEHALNKHSKDVRRMVLQTWVFNAKHRTSDLILDIHDWSAVPDDFWDDFIGFPTLGKYKATKTALIFGKGEL